MALVDFFQLALLHKLCHGDVGVPSDHTYPSPMPRNKRRRSPSPVPQPGLTDTLLSLSAQLPPKTPHHNRINHSVACTTPIAIGTAMMAKIKPDTNKHKKYDSATYEQYIIKDLEHHRVFVDIDVFMKYVLHVPDDWKKVWGPIIEHIKRTGPFLAAHQDFTGQCDSQGVDEKDLYQPLVNMNNEILKVSESLKDESVKPAFGLRYFRNDPKQIVQGVMNNLSPDVVAVHKDFLPYLDRKDVKEWHLKKTNLTWANPLQTLEVKPFDAALVDGSHMPRLKVNGKSAATLGSKIVY